MYILSWKTGIVTFYSGTVTGDTFTTEFMLGDNAPYSRLDLYIQVTNVSGTIPTLNIEIQLSPDKGETWFAHPTEQITQATGSAQRAALNVACGGATRMRLNLDVGGTLPSFTVTAKALARPV